MKDLVFLLVTLGLIMLAMMFAQDRYYSMEEETTRQWQEERHLQPSATPSPSPTMEVP